MEFSKSKVNEAVEQTTTQPSSSNLREDFSPQAYSETDVHFKDLQNERQKWREDTLRLTNIVKEFESRCKMMQNENDQLETMIHKYRTEYDVDTSYLKKQVQNERERQNQWKDLYFKAHKELKELKRQNPNYQRKSDDANNNNAKPDVEFVDKWQRRRTRTDSDCQECEEGRQRQSTQDGRSRHVPDPLTSRQSLSQIYMMEPTLHSPKTSKEEHTVIHQEIPSFLHRSQVYKPSYEATMLKPTFEHSANYYKCHLCGVYYDSEKQLNYHLEMHNEQSYPISSATMVNETMDDCLPCPECNEQCKSEEEYRRHLLVHIFKCKHCAKTLDSDLSFHAHLKQHGDVSEQPYVCFLCEKQFSHVSHLTRHVLSHPDEQNFECVECGKQFSRKGHLTRHMSIHSKCRPYTCGDCGKTFAHRTHLRRHEIVHSGARPHQCRVCKQSFSRKSSLSRHYFIHTTEKPFVCPVCQKGFNRKGRLRNHLKIHIREGYPQLVDYVIERRPITKEFIENINLVDVQPAKESIAYPVVLPTQVEQASTLTEKSKEVTLKEESEETSSSESEEEQDADLSEEIGYFEPLKTNENIAD